MRFPPLSPSLSPMFLALAVLLGGCAATRSPDAVAEFGSGSIECDDLRTFARSHRAAADDTPSDIVQQFVVEQLLTAEARRTGVDRAPEVTRRLRKARRLQLLEATESSLVEGLDVSDADVEAYYAEHGEELNRPERVRARIILRELPRNASRAAVAGELDRLREIQAMFLSGSSFADLAVRYSQDESAAGGGLLPPFERSEASPELARVIDSLEPGELSDVVRLPQGLALVQLEGVDEATSVPFEDVALEMRGRLLRERREERLRESLAEARSLMSAQTDDTAIVSTAPGAVERPVVRFDEGAVTLADLGLEDRPPFLREAVRRAVDEELLLRLAERNAAPSTLEELARLREEIVADVMLDRLVQAQTPPINPNDILARYEQQRDELALPERRIFAVIRIQAERGDLQEARAAAEAIARIWRPDGPMHQRNRAEVWGPISAAELSRTTTEELSRAAFALQTGETTEPLLVESGAGNLGYVLLRLHEVLPEGVPPYDEVRDRLADEIREERAGSSRARVRSELLQRSKLKILPPLFACDVHAAPAPAAASIAASPESESPETAGDDAPPSTVGADEEPQESR